MNIIMSANNNSEKKTPNLQLDINPDVAKGTYSNLAIISHSPTEIILDFAQMVPGVQHPTVRERIIMNPIHAKRLLSALADNINKFEQNFGPINEAALPNNTQTIPYDLLGKA
jgi:hypothetical protein